MPFINVKIKGKALTAEQTARIQTEGTRLLADILHKDINRIGLLIEQDPSFSWAVAGRPVQVGANVDSIILQGANTAEEKAQYIAATYELLHDVIGSDLPNVTFVNLHELPIESWGFGGVTNAHRYATSS